MRANDAGVQGWRAEDLSFLRNRSYNASGLSSRITAMRASRQLDPRFVVHGFEPAYFEAYRRGELSARVETALAELEDCCACPRMCHVNRLENTARVCNTGRYAVVSSAFPHFGEEDCLRGWHGSGTIFFGLCNLRCVFCQNWDISQQHQGAESSASEIAALMLSLQDRGCHNINFVTPEHVAPQVVEAIAAAVPRGLKVPIVYKRSRKCIVRSAICVSVRTDSRGAVCSCGIL